MSDASSLLLYISTFVLSSLLFGFGLKRNYRFVKYAGLALPIALASARYMVGTDYQTYISIYDNVSDLNLHQFLNAQNSFNELGYFLMFKLSRAITSGPYLMFALSSTLTMLFFYLGLNRHNLRNKGLTYFLYLMIIFPSTLNLVRQGLAISIVFFALSYLTDRNLKKFVLWILVASLFHISALAILPLYLINRIVKDNKSGRTVIFKTFVLSTFLYFLLPEVIHLFSSIPLFSRYIRYQTTQVVAGNNLTFFLKAFVLSVILIFSRHLLKLNRKMIFYISFAVIELMLSTIGFTSAFMGRIALYLSPFSLLLVASLPLIFSDRLGKYFMTTLIVVYGLLYFYIAYYLLGQSDLFPYQLLSHQILRAG